MKILMRCAQAAALFTAALFVGCGELAKKESSLGLIVTPPSYYTTVRARYLGEKYQENLQRIVERVVQNPVTGKLQFANNIASVGGIGFFTHAAAKSFDERYLEVMLGAPDVFDGSVDFDSKVDRLLSQYGSELLSILASDSEIYKDKEVTGYGLNFSWRNAVQTSSGPRVTLERAVIYVNKADVRRFTSREVGQTELLASAVIFALQEEGPARLVSYLPQVARGKPQASQKESMEKESEIKAEMSPKIQEYDLASQKEEKRSVPPAAKATAREQATKKEDEARRQEEASKRAEEAKRQQEVELAEAARRAEIDRQEEVRKREEQTRRQEDIERQEEAKRVEAARLAETAKRDQAAKKQEEEAQRVEEAQRQEEAKKQAEARLAEAARQAETKRQEKARGREEEAKRQEEIDRQEEAKRVEAAKLMERAKQEEIKRQEEAKKREEEAKRVEEIKRQKEKEQTEARLAEAARQAELKRQEEARKREEEAKRVAEVRRQEEAKKQAEAQRAEAVRLAEIQRQEEARKREELEAKRQEDARRAEIARLAEIARQDELKRQEQESKRAEAVKKKEAEQLALKTKEAAPFKSPLTRDPGPQSGVRNSSQEVAKVEKPETSTAALKSPLPPSAPSAAPKQTGSSYVVQLSFAGKEEAKRWFDRLRNEGYSASMSMAGEGETIRLRVGNFLSHGEASRVLGKLRGEGIKGIVLEAAN